ncbi:MAG TPA: 50S ribosomal protein L1 [Alphaproteobacteria bacterium]|nr:50S ribosomal protein L1 [Alphaproteobacteria bacterium]
MAAPKKKEKTEKSTTPKIAKGNRSVRYAKATVGKDFAKVYSLKEAVALVKSCASAKFDESVDVAVNLGIDVKQTDQNVRGVISLPNGTGKKVTIAVFARDKKADEAKKAGAQIIGAEDLIEKVAKGEVNFDKCIATPDMMPLLGKVAKVLGPKGLMPNPKLGSVSDDVATAVKNALAGQVEYRADKAGVIHAMVGKASFAEDSLVQNVQTLIDALNKAKPSNSKGVYLKKVSLSSTMGPSVKVVPGSINS